MQVSPRKIKLAAGNETLAVEWSDGHVSAYPYRYLREKCPCASCTDAEAPKAAPAAPAEAPKEAPPAPAPPLPAEGPKQ